MKETNMEHYRGEIEKLGFNIAVVDGEVEACGLTRCAYCDLVGGCRIKAIKWLMSEYKPEPVLTAREKHFVEFIQTGYIARDEEGELWWYKTKPTKRDSVWKDDDQPYRFNKGILNFEQCFRFITWEDEEPWSVEELRKLKVCDG